MPKVLSSSKHSSACESHNQLQTAFMSDSSPLSAKNLWKYVLERVGYKKRAGKNGY